MRASLTFLALLPCLAMHAQPQAAVEFEGASVKRSQQGAPGSMRFNGGPGTPDPGNLNVRAASLFDLIVLAYSTTPYQVSGPEWLKREYFDIVAKLPSGSNTRKDMMSMLQNLLKERFKLAVHKEERELPIYELSVTKEGPKFKTAEKVASPVQLPEPVSPRNRSVDTQGYPVLSDRPVTERALVRGHITAKWVGIEMEALVNQLRPFLDRPIIDRTGLTGRYDVVVRYLQGSALRDGGGPNLTEAFESQLGLKLESTKGLADVWVVDRADKVPVEN